MYIYANVETKKGVPRLFAPTGPHARVYPYDNHNGHPRGPEQLAMIKKTQFAPKTNEPNLRIPNNVQ